MADDDKDFTFGDVGEDFSGDDGWGALEDTAEEPGGDFDLDAHEKAPAEAPPEAPAEPAAGEKPPAMPEEKAVDEQPQRSSSSRMVLYGVLVVLLSAAGFYYFSSSPSPPAAPERPAATRQTLAMPERPEPNADTLSAPQPAVPVQTEAPAQEQVQEQVLTETEVPKGTLREVLPTEPPPAPAKAEIPPAPPVPPAVEPPAPEAPVVVTTPKPAVPPAPVERKKTLEPVKKPVAGKYSIQVGAFVEDGNRDEALAKIHQLGYEGTVVPIQRVMPMTRLLVGVYAPDVAKEKTAELAKIDPGAFYLHQGDQLAVYAGSYYEIGRARDVVAKLQQQGIPVTEEKTDVELTLSRLKFGGFPDKAAAENAAQKAREIGLEAVVIRNRQ